MIALRIDRTIKRSGVRREEGIFRFNLNLIASIMQYSSISVFILTRVIQVMKESMERQRMLENIDPYSDWKSGQLLLTIWRATINNLVVLIERSLFHNNYTTL